MKRIWLVHWREDEVPERLARLKRSGFAAAHWDCGTGKSRKSQEPLPEAYVIDLSRLPSHGKEVAMFLRQRKSSRAIPLVFVDGVSEKVAQVRAMFPDATFATWPRIKTALRQSMKRKRGEPIVPKSVSGPYSGTPLPQKLGIKPDSTVALIGAPKSFEMQLGQLPKNANVRRNVRGARDLTLWFVAARGELETLLKRVTEQVAEGHLWIAWPKKTSGVDTDLSEQIVRDLALGVGLVDYKVCAIDTTWSGLKFCQRRTKK